MTSFGKGTFSSLLSAPHPAILCLAAVQLRNGALAGDIVQETLAAVWDKQRRFREEMDLKTWMVAILKNKITNHFRHDRHSSISLEGLQRESEAIDEAQRACFGVDGHWLNSTLPAQWRPSGDYAEQQNSFRTLENCLGGLLEDTARIFYLREIMDMEVGEIYGRFDISKDSCYVILHRTRNDLRRCLQLRWFDSNAQGGKNMLKCCKACKLLSEAQDRKLTPCERLSFKLHLFVCIHCRRYRKQLVFLRANLKKQQRKLP